MKYLLSILFVIISFQFLFAQEQLTSESGNLTVVIKNLENNDGVVRVGLYNSRANYEGKNKPFRGMKAEIKNNEVTVVFENISFGEYAVKVYHDENSNGELDKNFVGIPTEEYGFSNNATGSFGPADYDDAKFIFNQKEMTIEIDVY